MQPSLHQTTKLPPIHNKISIQNYQSEQPVNRTTNLVPYTQQQQNIVKFASMSSSLQRKSKPTQNQSMTNRLMNRLYKRSPSIGKRLQKVPTSKQNMNQSLLTSSYNRLLDVSDIPLRPKLPKVTRITLPSMSERPGPLRMGSMLIHESMYHNNSSINSPMAIDLLEIPNNAFPTSAVVQRQQTQISQSKHVTFQNLAVANNNSLRQQLQIQPARKKPRQLGTEKLSTAFTANFQNMKKPSPHDFIRLIQTDKRYESRFCYCKKSSPQFYQFQVVPYAIKDPKEFMTISARGVVHYIGEEVDYLSLAEWQRESKLYKQIRDIFFFKQYRYWKNFSLWKTLMRRTRIQIQRDYLRTKLLLTDPQLGTPLQIIRTTTFRLTRFTIVDLGCDRPMTLQQFQKSQHSVRKKLKRDVEAIENEIKQKLIESCDKSMQVFREQNRITLSYDAISQEDNQAIARADDDDQNKNAFLVGDDTRKQMPYTQKATMRQQCKRIVRYIKLVDYLSIDSKLAAIENSLNKVLKFIMFDFSHGDRLIVDNRIQDSPIFEVEVVPNVENQLQISFKPPLEHIQDILATILKKAMLVVCQAGQYLSHYEFEKYTIGSGDFSAEELKNKKLDLFDMALEKQEFLKLRNKISKRMVETFSIIRDRSRELGLYLEIYEKNTKFKAQDFREAEVELFKPTIERFIAEEKMLEEFDPIIDIHTVRLNAVSLKNKIKNCPSDCLMAMKKLMPILSEERLLKLRDQLKTAENRLNEKPVTVDEYVSFMRYVKQLEENVDDFTQKFDDCKQLHQIMEEYKIRIPEGNKLKFTQTYTTLSNVRNNVQKAITQSQTSEIKWQKELSAQLPGVDKEAEDLIEQLQDSQISNPNANVEDICSKLSFLGGHVTDVQNLSTKLQDHQSFLNMEVTKFDKVENLMNEFVHKNKLWNGLQSWASLTEKWINNHFLDLNVELITQKVEYYFIDAVACKQNLDSQNPVPALFLKTIEQFRKMLPLLTYLRSQALTKRHWSEINKIVGNQINPRQDPELTLKVLMQIRVPQKTQQIGQVTMKAEKQKQLAAKLQQIKSNFMACKMPIIPYKDSKEYFAIGSNVDDDCLSLLEISMLQLNTMLNSRYISPLLNEVEKLYKRMYILQDFIEECVVFQRKWSQIQSLFTGSEMLKYVPNQVKRYNSVDIVWKSLMRTAADQPQLAKFGSSIKENPVDLFRMNNRVLQDIERGLTQWFEKKRFQFPRFFFLSNEQILFFLSGARNIDTLQPHFMKIYPAIKFIDIAKNPNDSEKQEDITAVVSQQMERFVFSRNVKARGFIEQWLQQIENEIAKTLKKTIRFSSQDLENAEIAKQKWLSQHQVSQILLTSQAVYWVRTTELVITDPEWNENMPVWKEDHKQFIEDLNAVLFKNVYQVSLAQFYTIRSIILNAINQRDILREIQMNRVTSLTDYTWRKQLRTYLEEDLLIRQAQNSITYGYEYQGAKPRLAIVPSTQRCWLSASCALQSKFSLCIVGGFGSGKSQTLRDFASIHGKYLLELPNPQQFSTNFLELALFGMMSTNTWINVLEVNELESQCLALLGHFMSAIRNSLLASGMASSETPTATPHGANLRKEIVIEGKNFTLSQPLGFFCTLTPESSKVHGRAHMRDLPIGFMQNLRSIAMVVPDTAKMFELIFTVSGFLEAEKVTKKLLKWKQLLQTRIKISQERQSTLDLSFRSLRQIVEVAALTFKNQLFNKVSELAMLKSMEINQNIGSPKGAAPGSRTGSRGGEMRRPTMMLQSVKRRTMAVDLTEESKSPQILEQARNQVNQLKVVYKTMSTFTIERLNQNEMQHFKDISHDVFPGCEDKKGTQQRQSISIPGDMSEPATHRAPVQKFEYQMRIQVLTELMKSNGYEPDKMCLPKILNFVDVIKTTQKGVVILGPPDQGKSTLWKVAQLVLYEEEVQEMAENEDSEAARQIPKPDYRVLFPNAYTLGDLFGRLIKIGQENQFIEAASNHVQQQQQPKKGGFGAAAASQQNQSNLTGNATDWHQGQVGTIVRHFLKSPSTMINWMVFDGAIKPQWADPLLPLIQEPYTLFLRTGDRLRVNSKNIKFIFETDDLSQAPPNLLSRVQIFLQKPLQEPESVDEYSAADWRSLSLKLIQQKLTKPPGGSGNVVLPKEAIEYISGLCDNYIPKGIEFIKKSGSTLYPSTYFQYIRNLVSYLQAMISPSVCVKQTKMGHEIEQNMNLKLPMDMMKKVLIKIFIFAYTWAFAGHLNPIARPKFQSFISDEFNTNDLPKGSVFDSFINFQRNFGDYEPWKTISEQQSASVTRSDSDSFASDIIIPTKNFITTSLLLRYNLQTGHPVVLIGPRGCGKSSVMKRAMGEMRKSANMRVFLSAFCCSTSTLNFQSHLEKKLERRGRALLTGPKYKPAILMFDDMHLPSMNDIQKQGSLKNYYQQRSYVKNKNMAALPSLHEHKPSLYQFMTQLFDQNGFTDRQRHFHVSIQKCSFAFTADRNGASHSTSLHSRLFRYTQIIYMPAQTQETIQNSIFQPIVQKHLVNFKQEVKDLGKAVINATFIVYSSIQRQLRPTPAKPTYHFTLRNLSNILSGIQLSGVGGSNRPDKLTRLWVHQFEREISDSLSHQMDRQWVRRHLQSMVNTQFRFDWTYEELFVDKRTLFGNFMQRQMHIGERKYQQLRDLQSVMRVMEQYISDYNQEQGGNNRLSVAMFQDYARLIAKFVRAFTFSKQHLLIIGHRIVSSSSALKLASFICKHECNTFENVMRQKGSIGIPNQIIRSQIRRILLQCGLQRKSSVLVLNQEQLDGNQEILNDLQMLMSCREITDLLDLEDMSTIEQMLRTKGGDQPQQIYDMFRNQINFALHLAIVMRQDNIQLIRERLRLMPSLHTSSRIVWLLQWPNSAFQEVAQRTMKNVMDSLGKDATQRVAQSATEMYFYALDMQAKYNQTQNKSAIIVSDNFTEHVRTADVLFEEMNIKLKKESQLIQKGMEAIQRAQSCFEKNNVKLNELEDIIKEKIRQEDMYIKEIQGIKNEAMKQKEFIDAQVKSNNQIIMKVNGTNDKAAKRKLQGEFDSNNVKIDKLRKEQAKVAEEAKQKEKIIQGKMKARESLDKDKQLLEQLIGSSKPIQDFLSHYRNAWVKKLGKIQSDLESLPGRCLTVAAIISYAGSFDLTYRQLVKANFWHATNDYQFTYPPKHIQDRNILLTDAIIGMESDYLLWRTQGLPEGELAQQSAVMVMQSLRKPLIIDPVGVIQAWLGRARLQNDIRALTFGSDNFLRDLLSAIKMGFEVMITGIHHGHIPEILDPILESRTFVGQKAKIFIKIASQTIPYDPKFRLYLFTTDLDPQIAMRHHSTVNIINFGFNREGVQWNIIDFLMQISPGIDEQGNPKKLIDLKMLGKENDEMRKRQQGYEKDLITSLADLDPQVPYDEKSFSFIEDIRKLVVQLKDQLKDNKKLLGSEYFKRLSYMKPAKEAALIYEARYFLSQHDSFMHQSFSGFSELVHRLLIKFVKEKTKKNHPPDMNNMKLFVRKNLFKELTLSMDTTQRIGMALYILFHQMQGVQDQDKKEIFHPCEKLAMLGILRNDKSMQQHAGNFQQTADSLGGRRHKQLSKKNPALGKRLSWVKVSQLNILERVVERKISATRTIKVFEGILASFESDLDVWLQWAKGVIFQPDRDLVNWYPRKTTIAQFRQSHDSARTSSANGQKFLTPQDFRELRMQMIELPVIRKSQKLHRVVESAREGTESPAPDNHLNLKTLQKEEKQPVQTGYDQHQRWDQRLTDFQKLLVIKYLAPQEFKRHALLLLQKWFKQDQELEVTVPHSVMHSILSAKPNEKQSLVPVVIDQKDSDNDKLSELLKNSKSSRSNTPSASNKNTPTSKHKPSPFAAAASSNQVTDLQNVYQGNIRSFSLAHDNGVNALKAIRQSLKRPILLLMRDVDFASPFFFRELIKMINLLEKSDVNDKFRVVFICVKNPRLIVPKLLLERSLNVVIEEPQNFEYHFEKTMKATDQRVWSAGIQARKAIFALSFMHAVLQSRKQYKLWASSYEKITIQGYHLSTNLMLDFTQYEHPNNWDDMRKLLLNVAYGAVVMEEDDDNALKVFLQAFLRKNRAARGQFRFPGEVQADQIEKKQNKRKMAELTLTPSQPGTPSNPAVMSKNPSRNFPTARANQNTASLVQAVNVSFQYPDEKKERWWNEVPPELANLDEYLDFIQSIQPNEDFARIIGVHPSVQLRMDAKQSHDVIDILSNMAGDQSKVSQQPGGDVKVTNQLLIMSAKVSHVATTASGQNSRIGTAQIAKNQSFNVRGESQAQDLPRVTLLERDVCVIISDMLVGMPNIMQDIDAAEDVFTTDKYLRLDPICVFLKQEMERYNAIIRQMTSDCEGLKSALAGQFLMNRYYEYLYHKFLMNQIPQKWQDMTARSNLPLMAWFKQIKQRAKVIYSWLTKGKPIAFYVPAFLNPHCFFRSLLQQYIRKKGCSAEKVGLFTQLQPYRAPAQIPEQQQEMENAFFIYGLRLRNAMIDMEGLALQDSVNEFSDCPVILLKPSDKYRTRQGDYQCPVLRIPAQRAKLVHDNKVFVLDLLTDVPSERWVVVGAVLVCDE